MYIEITENGYIILHSQEPDGIETFFYDGEIPAGNGFLYFEDGVLKRSSEAQAQETPASDDKYEKLVDAIIS